jgi:hypothetical protein
LPTTQAGSPARHRAGRLVRRRTLVGPAQNGHTRKLEAFARADDVESM